MRFTDETHDMYVGKIREILDCMRNSQFEVPFIETYRREVVDKLDGDDNYVWQIYDWDEKVQPVCRFAFRGHKCRFGFKFPS